MPDSTIARTAFALFLIASSAPRPVAAQAAVLELDHVYIVVQAGGAAGTQALRQIGLVIDTAVTRHDGQGTASVAAFFENAYLELLWVDSSVAVDSSHRKDLADFLRAEVWNQSGASPLGLGLHWLTGTPSNLGIPFRLESGAWMRPGTHIVLLRQPEESLAVDVFILPEYSAVTSWLGRYRTRRPDLFSHPLGIRRITRALVHGRPNQRPRAATLGIALVRFEEASTPGVELEFDDGVQGKTVDLSPVLPLRLRY